MALILEDPAKMVLLGSQECLHDVELDDDERYALDYSIEHGIGVVANDHFYTTLFGLWWETTCEN